MTSNALASVLDTAASASLHADLLTRIELRQPVLLDGAKVERVGLACLQVLLAARNAAESAELSFSIANPSERLSEMASLARLERTLEPVQ